MSRARVNCGLIAFLLAALLFPAISGAQETAETGIREQEDGFPESTSLWKVETDTGVVYLMGSIHLLKETDFPLHPKMNEAFERAGTLVFEAELDSAKTLGFQQFVFAKALYDSGKTLRSELGDSAYSYIGTQMTALGIGIEQMNRFEPWMVALTFLTVKLQQLGFSPEFGLDAHFYEKAKAGGIPIEALETPEYQIGLFDSMSPSLQLAMVYQTLEQASDMEKMLESIMDYWRAGDLEGLEATMNKSLDEFPELRELLFTKRNRDWIPKIEQYIGRRGTTLIIMGVGHMAGEDGVAALLMEAGYHVEQL
jgi:uncharacterized protein YbaP (TraB family)